MIQLYHIETKYLHLQQLFYRPYQKKETTCGSTEVQIYKSYKELGGLFNEEADDEGEHSSGATQRTMPNA